MEFFDINTILQVLYPLVTIAQIVACSVALRRIGGTGPVLMMVGTVLNLLVAIYAYYRNLAMDFAYDSEEMIMSIAGEQALGITGRVIFLVGLLLLILRAPAPAHRINESSMKY